VKDEDRGEQARVNSIGWFRFVFDPKAMDTLVNRVERNGDVANLLLTKAEARTAALELMCDSRTCTVGSDSASRWRGDTLTSRRATR
jgi:hypothetical protein